MSLKSHSKGSDCPPLENGKLRLYSMRFCPFAQRTRLVLAHKKIPFETVNIDLKNKPDWFLEKNPLGLVPVLEQDDKIVFESAACNDYLDDVYPQNKLTPSDPYRKARDRMLLEMNGKVVTAYYKSIRAQENREEALKEYTQAVEPLERIIQKRGKFFGGDQPAMIDFLVWPWFERVGAVSNMGLDMLPEDKFPNLNRYIKDMKTVPAVKETMFDDMSHLAFYKSVKSGKPDYDMGL